MNGVRKFQQDKSPAPAIRGSGLVPGKGPVEQHKRVAILMNGKPGATGLGIPGKEDAAGLHGVKEWGYGRGPSAVLIAVGGKEETIPRGNIGYCAHCLRCLMVDDAMP